MKCALVLLLATTAAYADDGADARAKALFDEGKTAFAEGNYGKACDKLAASYKLAQLSSTRGLLAACYEKIGKLASAWVAYRDSAAIAERQGNAERAQAARDKAAELEPKLAKLAIDITAVAKVDGIEITIDGVAQPRAALDTPLPIDGGPHVVAADALGWKRWQTTIDIADGEKQRTAVPALVADPAELEAAKGGGGFKRLPPRKLAGLGLAGGGAITLGVAAAFGVAAKLEWNGSHCTSDGLCPDLDAKAKADSAARTANIATVLGVAGVALAATGVVLYVTGGQQKKKETRVVVNGGGLAVIGRF
jgi:tetratricopeptide (TPR) repeat protein